MPTSTLWLWFLLVNVDVVEVSRCADWRDFLCRQIDETSLHLVADALDHTSARMLE